MNVSGNSGDWVSRCKLVKRDDGVVKCNYYQIFTVYANCCLVPSVEIVGLIMCCTEIEHGVLY